MGTKAKVIQPSRGMKRAREADAVEPPPRDRALIPSASSSVSTQDVSAADKKGKPSIHIDSNEEEVVYNINVLPSGGRRPKAVHVDFED